MDKFKTITSIGSIGLVAVIVYLFWQVDKLKDTRADQIQEINTLHWMLSAKEAETDSIKDIGQYAVPETVLVSRVRYDTTDGRIDTVLEQIPKISGSIKIDTTKEYGPKSSRLSIHVSGQFYYPEEYSYRNWMLIVPNFRKPPVVAKQQKMRSYAVGLGIAFKTPDEAYFGLQGRFRRTSLGLSYNPWRKTALMTVGFDILRF